MVGLPCDVETRVPGFKHLGSLYGKIVLGEYLSMSHKTVFEENGAILIAANNEDGSLDSPIPFITGIRALINGDRITVKTNGLTRVQIASIILALKRA